MLRLISLLTEVQDQNLTKMSQKFNEKTQVFLVHDQDPRCVWNSCFQCFSSYAILVYAGIQPGALESPAIVNIYDKGRISHWQRSTLYEDKPMSQYHLSDPQSAHSSSVVCELLSYPHLEFAIEKAGIYTLPLSIFS